MIFTLLAAAAPADAQAPCHSGADNPLALSPATEAETPAASPLLPVQDMDLSLTLDPNAYALAEAGGPAGGEKAPAPEAPAAAPYKKGPPLPLHTVEGNAGVLFVPMAYMINPGPPGTVASTPAASYTMVKVGRKTVTQFVITETVFRRIELGYMFGVLGLGDFPGDVKTHTMGVDIGFENVVLHSFNVRGMLIEEKEYIPAVTAGVTFKYNPNVQDIDRRLFGGVRALGMARSNGVDYILTASKTIPNVVCGRPIILTGGGRLSQAAQLGYLGFGDAYRLTWEGDICCPVTDWLAVSYEYRQKKNPYKKLGNLVGDEDDWQALCFAFILSDRLAIACGWGHFGNVVNHHEAGVWGFQVKYEF